MYRITNTSAYDGYATLGSAWRKLGPGESCTSEYEPKNVTSGIKFVRIASAGSESSVAVRDAVPSGARRGSGASPVVPRAGSAGRVSRYGFRVTPQGFETSRRETAAITVTASPVELSMRRRRGKSSAVTDSGASLDE